MNKELWIILALCVIALVIRLYRLGTPGLSDYEIITALRTNLPFWNTIFYASESTFPPLYYIFQNAWVHVFGIGEWALRFPSAVFSSLTILAIYKLGSELFCKRVGLIAGAMLTFSSFAINYAQLAKMYSLFWLFSTITFIFFFRLLKVEQKRNMVFYAIFSVLSCYTMYTGFLILIIQNVMFFVLCERSRWGKWLSCQAVIILSCLPWVIYFLGSHHTDYNFDLPYKGLNYFTFLVNAFLWFIGNYRDRIWNINFFLYSFLLVCFLVRIFIFSFKDKSRKPDGRINEYGLLMWVVVPIILYFTADRFFLHTFNDTRLRYIGFLQIPLILIVSSQMINFRGWIVKLLCLAVLGMAVNNTYLYFKNDLRQPKQDWRVMTKEVIDKTGKDDVILFFNDYYIKVFEYYHHEDAGKFFMASPLHCSSELLEKQGILGEKTRSIIVFYEGKDPEIKFNGFSLVYRSLFSSEMGFLQYQRT